MVALFMRSQQKLSVYSSTECVQNQTPNLTQENGGYLIKFTDW